MSDRRTQLLELLDQSGASLLALLTRLTLRQDVAEELMQDLFLRLSSAKDQGGIDCWYAYARRTAINLAFDWRRHDDGEDTGGNRRLSEAFPRREALLVGCVRRTIFCASEG